MIQAIIKYYRFHTLKQKHIHLNLCQTTMDNDLLKELVDEIQKYDLEIESLNLSKNLIDNKGCEYIADMLRKNVKIRKLDLSMSMYITKDGFDHIIAAIGNK